MAIKQQFFYPSSDGIHQINALRWLPEQKPYKGVIQIGSSYDTLYGTIGSYGALTSTSGSSGNAIIGCFEYRDTGKYVYYIASNDYSDEGDASVNLTFDKAYNVHTVKGTTSADYANRNSITINVPAGQGVLVVVG